MNGVHDMGGMHGFGPVVRETNEPLFHAAWEAHVRAIATLGTQHGLYNLDAFRYGIEQMPPAEYLRASYFERWLASVEHNLIEQGFLTAEELDARTAFFDAHRVAVPGADPPPTRGPARARPAPPVRNPLPHLVPRFSVGDAVLTRNVHPRGHTRLPRYARGKRGQIQIVHGPQIFPDTNALGLGEQPQVLYNVLFDARELWGQRSEGAAGPREQVALDLWESYLESVPS